MESTSSLPDLPAPVKQSSRIPTLDVLRGVALLGILLMNIPYFASDYLSGEDLRINDELTGINFYTWWIVSFAFEGTMRSIFSMLFGAGVLLLLQRMENRSGYPTGADIHYRRMIWLILFGMVHAYLLQWPGDILYTYGLVGLFLYPIRLWSAKNLLKAFGTLLVLLTIYGIFMVQGPYRDYLAVETIRLEKEKGTSISSEDSTKLAAWETHRQSGSLDSLRAKSEEIREKMRGNWVSSLQETAPASFMFETTKAYTNFFWDALLAVLLGMFLFKIQWLQGDFPLKKYLFVGLAAYAIGGVFSYLNVEAIVAANFERHLYAEHLPFMPYQIKRMGMALGHICLIITLWKTGIFAGLFLMLSRVGRMAFTNYIGQTLICTTLFYGFGFGLFGHLERYEWYLVVGAIWIFQLVFSTLWLRYYQYGPLEWIWRRLTYWKKISIRRRSLAEDALQNHLPSE
jgi:uncharacterized protein